MINIIIADHEAIFRAGVAKLLAAEEDFRIVGQPVSADQMLNALEKLRPHVLILSSSFQPFLGTIREIAARQNVAVLVICHNSEDASHFMHMGAQGVIYRSIKPRLLVRAVRHIGRGHTFLQTAHSIEIDIREDLIGARVRERLSERELRIIAAVVQGYKNREIAAQLLTSEQVVKNALRNIFDKTGVFGRLDLALFVVHHRTLAEAAAAVERQQKGPRSHTTNETRNLRMPALRHGRSNRSSAAERFPTGSA